MLCHTLNTNKCVTSLKKQVPFQMSPKSQSTLDNYRSTHIKPQQRGTCSSQISLELLMLYVLDQHSSMLFA